MKSVADSQSFRAFCRLPHPSSRASRVSKISSWQEMNRVLVGSLEKGRKIRVDATGVGNIHYELLYVPSGFHPLKRLNQRQSDVCRSFEAGQTALPEYPQQPRSRA